MKKTADALEVTFPSDREVVLTRQFDAPRALVFEAWTRPEHVAKWYGCHGSSLVSCEIDLRIGGAWRYVLRHEGKDFEMRGVYREIVRPERLVYTEIFGEFPDSVAVVAAAFQDVAGRTRLVTHVAYESPEVLQAVLAVGMQEGAAQTYERLELHLASMA